MCGIAGIYNIDGQFVEIEVLKRMCQVLKHRGPDDYGFALFDTQKSQFETFKELIPKQGGNGFSVALGHRRLSIIDLSEAASQPMSNEDDSIWIVLNGEIYNYIELREGLKKRGHYFKSHSDTEVVLHLYEELGIKCLKDLRGMFAFAIWDQKRQRFFLARDRVGKKPLSYFYDGKCFLFASEIKSIIQDRRVKREIDFHALHDYLTYGYIPSPASMFRGIKKLPPGHFLICDKDGVVTERYWCLSYAKKLTIPITEYERRIIEILKESIRIRLRSDVPLGAFLSGGIDSSSVVALMSEFSPQRVKTFTIGFEDEDYSELRYARIVAEKFSTEHHEFIVRPEAIEILPKLIWYYNEPYGDSSCIPTYYVSKMTREYVTVALNGDGGDESFAGYLRYSAMKLAELMDRIPKSSLNLPLKILQSIRRRTFFQENHSLRYLENFIESLLRYPEPYQRYVRWVGYFTNDQKDNLYSYDLKRIIDGRDSSDFLAQIAEKSDAMKIVDKTMNVDVLSYLPEDLLVKVDIASMANSLEVRSPFLDHHLMEFAASIPANVKLKGLTTKHFFKKTLLNILPKEILYRRKMGFGVPISRWFRNELKEFVRQTLLDECATKRGFFKRTYVEKLITEHQSSAKLHTYRIWALLNLELWCRTFIDGMEVG